MRGIMFSEQMLQQITAGKKTQTRRIIKQTKPTWVLPTTLKENNKGYKKLAIGDEHCNAVYIRFPYKIGDILYIKETCAETCDEYGTPIIAYRYGNKTYPLGRDDEIFFDCPITTDWSIDNYPACGKWGNKLFMPQKFARYFIKITDIKAERLLAITEENAGKEGFNNKEEFLNYFQKLNKTSGINSYVWAISFERI